MDTVHAHLGLGRVSEGRPSPCGTWAVAVVARLDADAGRFRRHLWRVPLDGGAAPQVLTRGPQDCHTPRFRHDGSLAFLSARPATEDADPDAAGATQIWAFPLSGGEPLPLTDEPLGVTDFLCARDADVTALWTARLPGVDEADWRKTARDQAKKGPSALHYRSQPTRFWDHWRPVARPVLVVHDAAGRRVVTPDADAEHEHVSWDLSADGGWVVLTEQRVGSDRIHDADVVRLELADGSRTVLLSQDRVSFSGLFLSPDGGRLLAARWARVGADYAPGLPGVLDLATGTWTQHGGDWTLECEPAGWLDDRTALLTAPDRGTQVVCSLDTTSGVQTPRTQGGAWSGVHPLGGGFLGLRSDGCHPPEVHVCDADGGVRCPGALAGDAGLAERVTWTTHTATGADGTPIQWFEVAPRDAEGPRPGLIWVHGGPISSWVDGWQWRWNAGLFALQGYRLCLPNPRGSTGFGQDFIDGIWGNRWGGDCYTDVLACADAFQAGVGVDSTRVGLMGGSFGGYMANQVGATTDRFQCLVSHAGLFDLTAFYGTTDFPAFWSWQMAGDPYSDRDAFEVWSPSRGVASWKTPTLVVHGEKDYRVPIGEGLALFEALQRRGVESELLVFPDEGHWIQRPENIVAWHRVILDFLGRHLQAR